MSQLPKTTQSHTLAQSYPIRDDEISLVDIAKILIKNRRLMSLVFTITMIVTVVIALQLPKRYEYTTIYTIAQVDAENTLESAAGLQTKVNSLYIPTAVREFLQSRRLETVPFTLNVSSPRGSSLITITSQAPEYTKKLVQDLHGAIVERLKAEQDAEINRRLELLQQQIDSARKQIDLVKDAQFGRAGELIASYTASVNDLQAQANSFQKGNVSAVGNQSLQPKGTSKRLVFFAGGVLSLILAVISVFLREFMNQLYTSLKTDDK